MRHALASYFTRHRARGSALLFALCFVFVLAVAGVALISIAGDDRISAAKLGVNDRGLSCAEAGLQYARQFFGSRYETTPGWNTYLQAASGYRYDVAAGDTKPGTIPSDARADFDGDGNPDFWVSIRDDDDERPLGATHDPARDNNEMIVLRSECTNPAYAITRGGTTTNVVLESTLVHIQGSSGYGASGPTNSPDVVGRR
jgi:hypothetical protein